MPVLYSTAIRRAIAPTALLVSLSLPLAGIAAGSGQCRAASGATRTALVELYTSEGCSSCPPADKWLSGLAQSGGDAQLVPLAFHVDYWDYIGWPDRFARAEHTARQRQVARHNRLGTIYTPQVVVNGRDFRSWRWSGQFQAQLRRINRQPAGANIKLRLEPGQGNRITATGDVMLASGNLAQPAVVYVALYQNRQFTDVRAGENDGRRLRHDAIVRQLHGPLAIGKDNVQEFRQEFELKPDWERKDMGVAAFVQNPNSGEVLQSLRLALCR